MNHYRPHIFYLTQTLDNTIHWTTIFWSQEHVGSLKPLIYNIQVQTWAQKVLPEKILALWSPCKVVEESIYRKTLLGSRRGIRRALTMCIGAGFRLQYLQRRQGICINKPMHVSSVVKSLFSGHTEPYIVFFRLNISNADIRNDSVV